MAKNEHLCQAKLKNTQLTSKQACSHAWDDWQYSHKQQSVFVILLMPLK